MAAAPPDPRAQSLDALTRELGAKGYDMRPRSAAGFSGDVIIGPKGQPGRAAYPTDPELAPIFQKHGFRTGVRPGMPTYVEYGPDPQIAADEADAAGDLRQLG